MQTYWENLLSLLDELQAKGVKMRLSDDTAEFQFSVKKGVLSEEEKAGIEMCRESLTRALRLHEGLCVTCGMDAAKKPLLNGRQFLNGEWVPMSAPDQIKAKHPPMYCDMCWQNGAYLRLIGVSTSANRNTKKRAEGEPDTDPGMAEGKTLFTD